MSNTSGLRELSRQAVRSRIAEVAEELFVAQGFEATTVDEIAETVGMSQRTFFRYFASKEDAALDGFERVSDDFLARLTGRPLDETEWDSLRRAFDVMVEQCEDPERRRRTHTMHRITESSPPLLAAYLQRADRMQQRLLEVLVARAEERGETTDALVLRAVVGSAFACLQAVLSKESGTTDGAELSARLDTVMAAVRPVRHT
ncbi:TetR family transcriptional regulator [Nocardiopsis sp. Huas11]|uniref:TetR/AcrR family transcriptional regulator n=1 Tax=Nocardiopsis sp. Huas11 TaxID=2183912 RepID=UPI000EAC9E2D|nr:TetR family transcriptional regulator [Nocardiopsis sp. Huas11]RKS08028.1 TetR family transcriptional regulator [Nocardiopsis sp. Huas11]